MKRLRVHVSVKVLNTSLTTAETTVYGTDEIRPKAQNVVELTCCAPRCCQPRAV